MAKSGMPSRASQLLSLIVLSQVPFSAASPLVHRSLRNASASDATPHRPATAHSLSDVETSSWPATTYSSSSDISQATQAVVEISDGQIQAPYGVYTAYITSTSGAETFISTTTIARASPTAPPGGNATAAFGQPRHHQPSTSSTSNGLDPTSLSPSARSSSSTLAGISSSSSSSSVFSQSPPSTSTSAIGSPVQSAISTAGSSSSVVITSSVSSGLSGQSTSASPSISSAPAQGSSVQSPVGASSTSSSASSPSSAASDPAAQSSTTPASSSSLLTVSPSASPTQTSSNAAASPSLSSLTRSASSTTATGSAAASSTTSVSLTSLSTSAIQTATSVVSLSTTGSVHTSLETSGVANSIPFATSFASATSSISLVSTATMSGVGPTATVSVTSIEATNIFQAIATDAPPSQIPQRGDHPVPRLGIQPQQDRLQTNKFYANFFLGSQTSGTWTHPYSVSWSKGAGETGSWGLAISHVERSQVASGPADPSIDAGQWAYFVNPIGIQSLVLSATQLGSGTTLTTDTLEAFSVNVNLAASAGATPVLKFPLVQGMGFVTGVYNSGTPLIQSGIGIVGVMYAGTVLGGKTYKYTVQLGDQHNWLFYVTPSSSSYAANTFTLLNANTIQGPSGFNGYIQIAKIPTGTSDAQSVYDAHVGAYPTAGTITGSVSGVAGSYTLSWSKQGITSQPLLMFALPHHIESLSSATSSGKTDIQLETTIAGIATALSGDSWTLEEPALPVSMSFAPWTPAQGSIQTVSAAAVQAIKAAGTAELSQDVSAQTNVGSLYYDGKALAKFAAICYTVNDIAGDPTLAQTGLVKLKTAFALHVNNQMTYPLAYDSAWGGAVSSASYPPGNSGEDFGNTYYNDHHFHYGYFVYAAAVIGYLDPTWLTTANKAWVNMLVRDYANSISNDPYYPFQRMFDWYHGHSWAHGLYETADGKDQESSSEDTMASYGMKMWGQIIGDTNMEARGNLMLAVQQRSLAHYYLYTSDNTVEPAQFIGNKAAGILFENKIDHTTYFGNVAEYIEGIHMLPIMPFSPYTRSTTFVQQEWNAYFNTTGIRPASEVTGGWRGIIEANLAIIDPKDSYAFFSDPNFDESFLDGGASLTWYLTFSAALGGSPANSKV